MAPPLKAPPGPDWPWSVFPSGCPALQLLEWFDYRGHVCMVFERLGPSLYDILRKNGYKPFPLAMVRC